MAGKDLGQKTIADFGEQWTAYTDNDGYYGSVEILGDVFGPLISTSELAGLRIADIGAGTGRFTDVLLRCGASKVLAVEPSEAFKVLQANTAAQADRIEYFNVPGERFSPSAPVDLAFSYGVLHHVPNPAPVVAAMYRALREGGRIAIWLYGYEGNQAYVVTLSAVGRLTRRLPHWALAALVWLLNWPMTGYAFACRWLPLPLAGYMRQVFLKLSPAKRRLVLYDQLNPAYAKYYRREEAQALLETAGFEQIRLFHRHGYSWTAVALKPHGRRVDS